MGFKGDLKRIWTKQRITKIRIISKDKLAKRRAAKQIAGIAERIELEEVQNFIAGMGLESSNTQRESEEDDKDIDPRFADNPNGEGCSKSFESPSTETADSETIPSTPISLHRRASCAGCYDEKEQAPPISTERESVFDPRTWSGPQTLQIDWSKGKRKGKADADFNEGEELKTMQEWLAKLESGNITPQDGWTRQRIMAIMRGRAWTY